MYARERTGEGGVVLYVLSSVSLYACVCERLFLSVVMTVVLGQRCFDSLSKHKRMWLGWRQMELHQTARISIFPFSTP